MLMEEDEWADESDMPLEEDWDEGPRREEQAEKKSRTVVLQVEQSSGDAGMEIDLLGIMGHMKQKGRFFAYVLAAAVCTGWIAAAVSQGLQGILGEKSYASAVVSFSFDGIDEG